MQINNNQGHENDVLQDMVILNNKKKSIINTKRCKNAIKLANKIINGHGRMLVRKSGTESAIRIMCESENKKLILKCVNIVNRSIK